VMRLKVTASKSALRRQCFMDALAQFAIDPFPNRKAEAHLGPRQDLVRDKALNRALENVFCFSSSELKRGGNPSHEIDQFVIQKRRARFERSCHAHPIHFREDVAGQVSLAIKVKEGVERFW